jgi:hypothetical protein
MTHEWQFTSSVLIITGRTSHLESPSRRLDVPAPSERGVPTKTPIGSLALPPFRIAPSQTLKKSEEICLGPLDLRLGTRKTEGAISISGTAKEINKQQ